MRKEITDRLLDLCEDVITSADSTGCTEDLTVVSKEKLELLEDFIVNYCGID